MASAPTGEKKVAFALKPVVRKRSHCSAFQAADESDSDEDQEAQWAAARFGTAYHLSLESAAGAAQRKQDEANVLAESSRFGAALQALDAAIELEPSALRHEMRAQCFLELGRDFDAISAAEAACAADGGWAPGFQTLARARLNFGEIELAHVALSKAAELDPDSDEIRHELAHATELWNRLQSHFEEASHAVEAGQTAAEREVRQCKAQLALRLPTAQP